MTGKTVEMVGSKAEIVGSRAEMVERIVEITTVEVEMTESYFTFRECAFPLPSLQLREAASVIPCVHTTLIPNPVLSEVEVAPE